MPASTSKDKEPARSGPRSAPPPKAGTSGPPSAKWKTGPPDRGSQRFQPQPLIDTTGPSPDTPPHEARLVVGVVVGTHGIQGEVKIRPLTDDPDQLANLRACYFGLESEPRGIRFTRFHAQHALMIIAGVRTPEGAAAFKGMELRVPATELRPLESNELFLYQIIGLEAHTEDGEVVGRVTDLIETGAADVLVVQPPGTGAPILLANVPEFVLNIAPAEGRVLVRLPVFFD